MFRRSSALLTILLCALACAVSGCVNASRDGDTMVFTFAAWVPGLVFVAGAVALAAGIALRSKATGWAWVLMIGGPLASLVFAPGLYSDKATVDKEHFTLRTGFWFAPTVHDVSFSELSRIELTGESRMTRRGRRTSYYLLCHRKTGGSEKVPVGDLMKQGAAAAILGQAEELGISVIDGS